MTRGLTVIWLLTCIGRFCVLQALNRAFAAVSSLLRFDEPVLPASFSEASYKQILGDVPLASISAAPLNASSVSALVKSCRALLFTQVKTERWDAWLVASADAERSVRMLSHSLGAAMCPSHCLVCAACSIALELASIDSLLVRQLHLSPCLSKPSNSCLTSRPAGCASPLQAHILLLMLLCTASMSLVRLGRIEPFLLTSALKL
jgi:hypothetical protein